MAKLSASQKAERVLRFVLALRNPQVARVMTQHGFDPDAEDEVWTLFRSLAPVPFDVPPPLPPSAGQEALRDLNAWRKRWQPVVRAVLSRHYPEVYSVVQARSTQPRLTFPSPLWAEVIVKLIDEASERGSFDGKGPKIVALLRKHGLTPREIDAARGWLRKLRQLPKRRARAEPQTPDLEETIVPLWDWYLQWSQLARSQIHDGRLLRQLGFSRVGRKKTTARKRATAKADA